jgi:multisubunit Na+/H+ antiporter MnhC subunit
LSSQSLRAERRGRIAMRRALIATIVSLTATGVALAVDPNESRLIVQLDTALIGVIAVVSAAGALRRAAPLAPPSPLDRVFRPAPPAPQPLPVDLVRISRRLVAAEGSAADARRHLAPLVAAIAADRLRHRAHAEIGADSVYSYLPRPVPDALALVLDPALASLDTREMPGLDADASDAMVRALEQL